MTCQGILGRIFGHKYRPRYDVKERERPRSYPIVSYTGPAGSLRDILVLEDSTYICDVCLRCGDRIEREVKDAGNC